MTNNSHATPDAASAAFFQALAERSKTDPLIGAQMGAKEIMERLTQALRNERGVHIESLVGVLAALAGYACQVSVREAARAQRVPETALMTSVQTKDGRTFFVGDAINRALVNSQYSVWGIAAAGAQDAGCTALPDIAEVFTYANSTVGSASFGHYRVAGNQPGDLPANYLAMWPDVQAIIARFCPDPAQWPVLLAIALRDAIIWGKAVLKPSLALGLAMDTAVAMSMVDRGGK
jgi:hypothetical protein